MHFDGAVLEHLLLGDIFEFFSINILYYNTIEVLTSSSLLQAQRGC